MAETISTEIKNGTPVNYYLLAIGFGVAYGLIGYGFAFSWATEAFVLAAGLSFSSIIFKLWVFKEYVSECAKLNKQPKRFIYFLVQTFANCLRIFLPALIIIGFKMAFGIEHVNGRIWIVKGDPTSNRLGCNRFKESPDSLLKSVNSNGENCTLKNEDEMYQIICPDGKSMILFTSESNCINYIGSK